jgi:YD repeat-containing protein
MTTKTHTDRLWHELSRISAAATIAKSFIEELPAGDPKAQLAKLLAEIVAAEHAAMECATAIKAAAGAICLIIALLTAGAAMAAEQTRLYGPDGRSAGTATTDSAGTTTYRDAQGRTIGTATTSGGTTTFYDARGNVTGRSTAPPPEKRR